MRKNSNNKSNFLPELSNFVQVVSNNILFFQTKNSQRQA